MKTVKTVSGTLSTNYGSNAYTWDYKNRITQAGAGSATSTYGYDYQGERVSQTINGITTKYANRLYSTTGATTTKHIYAGNDLVAVVERVGSATTTHIIHTDHLGGTNVVTDNNGDLAQTIDYYPFGSLRINTRTTGLDEKRKFTGHEYDSEVNLNYMMARYQDPSRGQFLSQDPAYLSVGGPSMRAETGTDLSGYLSDPQNMNSYAYARNNPLAYRDPNGKFGVLALMGIGAIVGVAAQGIEDYSAGRQFQWQNYAGAAAGGAVGALSVVGSVAIGASTAAPYVAGGVGGATKETISQSLRILTGTETQHNVTQIGSEATKGTIAAFLPVPKLAGVTIGQNSFDAIGKQIVTKLTGNTIQNFTAQTGSKILTSQFISSGSQAVQVGIATNPTIQQTIRNQLSAMQAQVNAIARQIDALRRSLLSR